MQHAKQQTPSISNNPVKETHKAWLIQGVTTEGKRFRPSDWAERLSNLMARFNDGRLTYSPLLFPVIRNGEKCIHIDSRLQQESPDIYELVMEFARNNNLNIIDSL